MTPLFGIDQTVPVHSVTVAGIPADWFVLITLACVSTFAFVWHSAGAVNKCTAPQRARR